MADDEIKVKKERDPILMVCFIVFLLTVCAITGATVYNNYLKADTTVAVVGDTVSVNYIGTFYAPFGENNAVVFDTSHWSIANDDKVQKSNDFTLRTEANYKPLSFKVGGTDVLTGFGNAVIGKKVGEKIQVKLLVGEGYNAQESYTTVNATQTATMSATEQITASQFKTLYGFDLTGSVEIQKSVYGWPAIASVNSDNTNITMSYRPVQGNTYTAVDSDFGKVAFNVSSVTGSPVIEYKYVVSDFTVVSTSGANKNIQMIMVDLGSQKYYITSVVDSNNDGVAEQFTHRNVEERFNQVLYFEIEIVSIG